MDSSPRLTIGNYGFYSIMDIYLKGLLSHEFIVQRAQGTRRWDLRRGVGLRGKRWASFRPFQGERDLDVRGRTQGVQVQAAVQGEAQVRGGANAFSEGGHLEASPGCLPLSNPGPESNACTADHRGEVSSADASFDFPAATASHGGRSGSSEGPDALVYPLCS